MDRSPDWRTFPFTADLRVLSPDNDRFLDHCHRGCAAFGGGGGGGDGGGAFVGGAASCCSLW